MPMEKVLICIIVIWFHNGKMQINKFSTLPFILFIYFFGRINCILGAISQKVVGTLHNYS